MGVDAKESSRTLQMRTQTHNIDEASISPWVSMRIVASAEAGESWDPNAIVFSQKRRGGERWQRMREVISVTRKSP